MKKEGKILLICLAVLLLSVITFCSVDRPDNVEIWEYQKADGTYKVTAANDTDEISTVMRRIYSSRLFCISRRLMDSEPTFDCDISFKLYSGDNVREVIFRGDDMYISSCGKRDKPFDYWVIYK